MSEIRIGIVGCGRILAAHLRGYRLLREAGFGDFRITALCARQEADGWSYVKRGQGPAQRAAVSSLPGDPLAIGDEFLSDIQDTRDVRVFTDYATMIAEAGIDAVNDFTPHGLHHLVAEQAFRHGKHLLSQKPLGVTVRAARQMCERAADAGVTFGVFENARYRAPLLHAKWALNGGPAGRPQMAILGNVGTWWAPNLVVGETPWRHDKKLGGGLAIDLGVHQFDMIRQVLGEVETVQATAAVIEPRRHILNRGGEIDRTIDCDADDTIFASFTCRNGASGTLFGSFAGHGTNTVVANGPVFYGSDGRISGDRIHLDGAEEASSLAEVYAANADEAQKAADFPDGIDDHFALTQHHWLEAVRRGTQPPLDGSEGLLDLACAYALLESDLAGRRVGVAEVLDGSLEEYQRPINAHFGIG